MYTMMIKKNLKSTFPNPNIDIMLRIYLCMMVSNCSGESFFQDEDNKESSENNPESGKVELAVTNEH